MTSFPDSHRDLLDAQVASLATIGGDGFPQMTEVWFLHDDDELKLSLNTRPSEDPKSREAAEVQPDDSSTSRTRTAISWCAGNARIDPDDDYAFADKLGAKYSADVKVHDQPGDKRVVVTIEPTKVYPVDMSGGRRVAHGSVPTRADLRAGLAPIRRRSASAGGRRVSRAWIPVYQGGRAAGASGAYRPTGYDRRS